VKGTVLAADGRPLAGAPIEILGPAEPPATGWVVVRNATSGDDGTFDLPLLPSGPLRLRVLGAGHGTAADGVELDDAGADLRVPTTRLGRARLTLVTADGRPRPHRHRDQRRPGVPDRTTTTDARSSAACSCSGARDAGARWRRRRGYARSRRVAVAPGDDGTRSRRVDDRASRHRTVTDGRGLIAHACVVAAAAGRTTTDADGRYA
jgi:hypothetical protein